MRIHQSVTITNISTKDEAVIATTNESTQLEQETKPKELSATVLVETEPVTEAPTEYVFRWERSDPNDCYDATGFVSVSDVIPDKELHFYESDLYIGQPLDNVYAHSKFEAERIVLEAMTDGLKANIMRMGNLTNRSDGVFQKNYLSNAFLKRVKAVIDLAELIGVSHQMIHKRKKSIINKLKNFFES